MIAGINDARAQQGLAPVRAHRGLNRAADVHTRDMLRADFFDHPSSDGTPFERRVRRYADANMVGETLAALRQRHGGAGTVVQMWLNSPPHRAIVLEPGFRRIGVSRRWGTLGSAGNARRDRGLLIRIAVRPAPAAGRAPLRSMAVVRRELSHPSSPRWPPPSSGSPT